MSELFFKFLGEDGSAYHGGSGKWHLPKGKRPGKWMPKIETIEPCESGYHLCRAKDLLEWLAPSLWIAEGRGERIEAGDKAVFQQARLIKRVDGYNDKNLRFFAADCAERVLPIYESARPNDDRPRKAIEAARLYAEGRLTKEQLAAAGAAARDAAGAAAGAAARDAEKQWQTKRLLEYLGLESDEP